MYLLNVKMICPGEWEIGAFDSTLKAQGMSVRYSVFTGNCETLPLVDTDDYGDLQDQIDEHYTMPRGFRKKNQTVAIQVCQKISSNTSQTEQQNTTNMPLEQQGEKKTLVCKRKLVSVDEAQDLDVLSQGGIPQDILDQLDLEMGSPKRQKRLAFVENDTEAKSDHPPYHSHITETEKTSPRGTKVDGVVDMEGNRTVRYQDVNKLEPSNTDKSPSVNLFKKFIQKSGRNTSSDWGLNVNFTEWTQRELLEKNIGEATKANDAKSDNDVLKNSVLELDKLMDSLDPHKYAYKEVEHLDLSSQNSPSNSSQTNSHQNNLPTLEYDDYGDEDNTTVPGFDLTNEIDIRSGASQFHSYYIAAEEIMWDYGIVKPSQLISARYESKLLRPYAVAVTYVHSYISYLMPKLIF